MLRAFYFLDKGYADGMVGGRDIYQQGLADVWFVEDGGEVKVVWERGWWGWWGRGLGVRWALVDRMESDEDG